MTLKELKQQAERGQSRLTKHCLRLQGMSSPNVRHLLNILSKNKIYVEVGTHKGSTLVAACYDNGAQGIAFDSYVEFGSHTDLVNEIIKDYKLNAVLIPEDYRNHIEEMPQADVIFYDGDHKSVDTKEAMDLLWPKVKKGGVMVIDDYCKNGKNYEVKNTVDTWVKENKHSETLAIESNIKDDATGWWNGLMIIKK